MEYYPKNSDEKFVAWSFAIIAIVFVISGLIYYFYFFYFKSYDYSAHQNQENSLNETSQFEKEILTSETADWKNYRNDQYGFEIKIPKSWFIDDRGILPIGFISPEVVQFDEQNNLNCQRGINNKLGEGCIAEVMNIDIKFEAMSVDDFDSLIKKKVISNRQEVIFGDNKFYEFNITGDITATCAIEEGSTICYEGITYYRVLHNDNLLIFGVFRDKLASKILSTFKFTK